MDTSRREIDLKEAEKTIKRKIELHFKEELTNKNLKNNINQGIVLFE